MHKMSALFILTGAVFVTFFPRKVLISEDLPTFGYLWTCQSLDL